MAIEKICKNCKHYEHIGEDLISEERWGVCHHPGTTFPVEVDDGGGCSGWGTKGTDGVVKEVVPERLPLRGPLAGVSTTALVDEIVRRGHGDKHFIQAHDAFSLRSHAQGKTTIHAAGTGPVLFLAVID